MTLLFATATPALAGVLVALTGDRWRWRQVWTGIAAVVTLGLVVSLVGTVRSGGEPSLLLGSLGPGLDVRLRADPAGLIFALTASTLWLLATPYSHGYVVGANEAHRTRFFAAFALCVSTTVGLAFSANLFTFFLFYELLTLATYPLVVHKQTPAALAAGRRYLLTLLGGGAALLLAVIIVQVNLPGVEFTAGGALGGDALSDRLVIAVVVLGTLGLGTKAALMPLHGWLPAAMVAPTPVSALLHAVAVVKAGVFGFVRLFGYVIGPERLADVGAGVVVATLAAITIVTASVIAFRQDNLKRRLAYSTIAHLSYIVLGVSLLSSAAWTGALLHLANHAALKITLFFCAGAIYVTTGFDRVSQLDGLGRRMPVTMAAFGVASLGLAGLPPVGGFVSKWFLGTGSIDAGEPVLAAIVIGSGLLTAGYLLPIVHRAFFRAAPEGTSPTSGGLTGEAPRSMVIPLALTATIGLVLGLGDVFLIGELSSLVGESVTGSIPAEVGP